MATKLPKGIRRHIREEKARIRRQVMDVKEQEKLIVELKSKFIKKNKTTKQDGLLKSNLNKPVEV